MVDVFEFEGEGVECLLFPILDLSMMNLYQQI